MLGEPGLDHPDLDPARRRADDGRAARVGVRVEFDAQPGQALGDHGPNRGRVLAETRSAPLPGASLLVDLPAMPRQPTPYTRIGNLLGWICVAALGLWMLRPRRASRA